MVGFTSTTSSTPLEGYLSSTFGCWILNLEAPGSIPVGVNCLFLHLSIPVRQSEKS